jgi:hypothetical protein
MQLAGMNMQIQGQSSSVHVDASGSRCYSQASYAPYVKGVGRTGGEGTRVYGGLIDALLLALAWTGKSSGKAPVSMLACTVVV